MQKVWLTLLIVGASSCARSSADLSRGDGRTQSPIFSNGDFESDANNAVPPSPWVVTPSLNSTGLATVPPTSAADLQLSPGGYPVTLDVFGTSPQSDPDAPAVTYPKFGSHSVVINSGDGPVTTGTGSTLAKSGATMTLTDNTGGTGPFTAAMVGKNLVISGATTAANNGTFTIASRVSSHIVTYTNAAGVAEAYTGTFAANAGGRDSNVNKLSQIYTLSAGDVDPVDNKIHIRWVLAPVLQNGGHTPALQPYFFYLVKNVTKSTVLRHDFNFANQAGVPWQSIGAACPNGAGCIAYTDWQLIDVAPGAGAVIGDQIEVDIYASGCQPNGHWGRVYVDAFGALIPGFFVSGSAPTYALNNTDMNYTLTYQNNSGASILNPEIDFSLPAGTTYSAVTQSPSLGTCAVSTPGTGTAASIVAGAPAGQMRITGITGVSAANVGAYLTLSGTSSSANSGLFKIMAVNTSTPSLDVLNASATVPDASNGAITWSTVANVKCSLGTTLAAATTGTVTVTVHISPTTEGILSAGTYWAQGSAVSPLYGGRIDTVVSGPAASITAQSGTPQAATVNTAFTNALVAVVKDAAGFVVPNASVTWTTPASGASGALSATTVTTDLSGNVSTSVTANTVSGAYNITAAVSGVATAAPFALTNNAGTATLITVTSGSGQSAPINTAFASNIVVTLTDTYGNPVSGQTLAFTAPGVGMPSATFANTFVTNAAGQISIKATANAVIGGPYNVTVSFGALASKTFSLTNTGAATTLTITSGSGQRTVVGTAFSQPVVITLTDLLGTPVANQTVTFTPPGSGASASFLGGPFKTNNAGQVTVTPTANGSVGLSYNTTVSATGVTSKTLVLSNTGAPATFTITGGGQSAVTGSAFVNPIVVTVNDAGGNGVFNQTVNLTPPTTGAYATFSAGPYTTNASGVVSITATANPVIGGPYNTGVAIAATALASQNFALTNTGVAATLTVTSGSGQSTITGTNFPAPVVITITDANGTGVSNQLVVFTPPTSGAAASFPGGPFKTNDAGQVTVTPAANGTRGAYTVGVSSGTLTAQSIALANSGTASVLTVTSGSGQSTVINTAFANPVVITVTDSTGNPVANQTLSFVAPPGGSPSATAVGQNFTTNVNGQISIVVTANSHIGGPYNVTASLAGTQSKTFSLKNTGAAAAIAVSNGGQSTVVTTAFATAITITVTDSAGTGVFGQTVTLTPPATTTASATFAGSKVTDSNGQITLTATANTHAGGPYNTTVATGAAPSQTFALTNTPDVPASLSITGGGAGQSTTINTNFAQPITVVVKDQYGNPIKNQTLVLTPPPASVASLTTTSSLTTDATGTVSITATANSHAGGPYNVTVALGALSQVFTLTNQVGTPATIQIANGNDPQSAIVTQQYPHALQVTVLDAGGNPVPNASVSFNAPSAGPSAVLSAAVVVTDASGHASVNAIANTIASPAGVPFSVSAAVAGVTTPGSFALTNLAGAVTALRVVSGGTQSATPNTTFAEPLQVEAVDAYGNPVPGALITYNVPTSGATASTDQTEATTNASGIASVVATAGAAVGTYVVSATTPGAQQADFLLSNASTTVVIVADSGTPQDTKVATAFAQPFSVLVTNNGTPVAGALVHFSVPVSGASATLSAVTATTDATGHASVTGIAGTKSGAFQVIATVQGGTQSAVFAVTADPGAPAAINALPTATPQNASINTAFASPLVAQVVDTYGNPVPGASVTFTTPGTDPTATLDVSTAVTTDANGLVSVHATAGPTAGSYNVVAGVAGVTTSANFALGNVAGPVQSIAVVSGSPQSATVATAFTSPLVVLVTDASGQPVANQLVTFTVPSSGASAGLDTLTATTDASGHAQVLPTANTIAGHYDIVATTATSAAPAAFALTNSAGSPALITPLMASTPQSTPVTDAFSAPLYVRVTDVYGNPVLGVSVAVAGPASGATASFSASSVTTDADGVASVIAIASSTSGSYTVNATTAGVTTPAAFALTNLTGSVTVLTLKSGGAQSTEATTAFAQPLVFVLKDANGNPVANAPVTLTFPASGASATAVPINAITDATGQVSVTLTANAQLGDFTLSVSTPGDASPLSVELHVTAIPTVTVLVVTPAQATVSTTLTLTATVTSHLGTPTGVVRFVGDGAALATAPLSASGVAKMTIPAPALGVHAFTAFYDAQAAFGASHSGSDTTTVAPDSASSAGGGSSSGGGAIGSTTAGGSSSGNGAAAQPAKYYLNGGGGCSATGHGTAESLCGAFVAAAIIILRRRRFAKTLLLALVLFTGSHAQAAVAAPGVSLDTFHTAAAGSDWFTTDSLDFRGWLRPDLRALLDYANAPLVLYNANGTRHSTAVTDQLFLNIGGSLVFLDRFRFSLNLPVGVFQKGNATSIGGTRINPRGWGGLGDLRLSGDVRIFGEYHGHVTLAAGVDVYLPTGSQANLLGDGSVNVIPHLAVAGKISLFEYAAQAGFAFRGGQIANVKFNNELRLAVSAGVRVLNDKLLIGPEVYGSGDFGHSLGFKRPIGVEGDLGAHYQITRAFRASLGIGTGFGRSPGVPDFRVLAGLDWTPGAFSRAQPAPEPVHSAPPPDRDGDGVIDANDICPDVAKGTHPDPARLGCPENDTDQDGLLDSQDSCPTVAQGIHPDTKHPGCPDTDRDGDGVYDSSDLCPDVPAGLSPDASQPGCPLSDRDGDSVPDTLDACPDKPGAPSADAKTNGCPGLVTIKNSQIVILTPVQFATGKDKILEASFKVLESVAAAMQAVPDIKRVSIEGHTDSQGKPAANLDLSTRRAAAVRKWLVLHGIAAERVESHGFGATKPKSTNATARGRADNRRVEFHIVEQPSTQPQ